MDLKESSIKKAKQILQWVTWRDLLDSVALFLVFFFIIRTLTAEAFVIPTGSMAPSLMGNHAALRSPYNGYEFEVGRDLVRDAEGKLGYTPQIAIDPMTNREFAIKANNYQSGDRILVLKYMAPFHTPKRWDVCVFKAPQAPQHNYIKRLIGMPGEELKIAQGNIYTRPLDSADDAAWSIQRKPLRIQKHLWFPIYHSQYHSINPLFWKQNPDAAEFNHEPFESPWQAQNPSNWNIQDGRIFNYKGKQEEIGQLKFVYHSRGTLSGIDYYAYNPRRSLRDKKIPNEIVEDLRISSVITPFSNSTIYRKILKVSDATLKIELEGVQASLSIIDAAGKLLVSEKAEIPPLTSGIPTKVELWHADQSLRLMINDKQVGNLLEYDVPMSTRIARYTDPHIDFNGHKQTSVSTQLRLDKQPEITIEIEGLRASIRNLNLDRDQHYAQSQETNNDHFFAYQMKGDRRAQAVGVAKNAARIPKGYYFALGDNSANSNDSRVWGLAHPMVRQWHYALTQEDIETGTIPARMMIGRGIMVYFPATIGPRIPSASPVLSDWGIIPDLKKTRLIH